MEDREIIALYNQREEQAISATRSKYGAFLYGIAMNILRQSQDAEECESDTYHFLCNTCKNIEILLY